MDHPKVQQLLALPPQAAQGSQEWFQFRQGLLGASDYPSALGNNPYCSRRMLVRKKTGQVSEYRGGLGSAVQHGHDNEPIAVRKYEQQTGEEVLHFGCIVHRQIRPELDIDFMGASIDGICRRSGRLVEIKCPKSRPITDEVPGHYWDQVQGQMEVLDVDECDFVQFRPDSVTYSEQLVVTRVRRDPNWATLNIPRLREVWDEIKTWQRNEAECRDLSRRIANAAILGQLDLAGQLIDQRRPLLQLLKPEKGSRRPRRSTKRPPPPPPPPSPSTSSGICLLDD